MSIRGALARFAARAACLRDVGRFGLLVLVEGEAFNGPRVLPPSWRDLASQPDRAATGFGRLRPEIPAACGYRPAKGGKP